MPATLYYIHDPMCSWCWGFRPTLDTLLEQLPDQLRVKRLLGGLAPDSDQPMPQGMQQMLQQTWQQIQATIPGTRFNFAFWTDNQPRRSTWPSCRAILAARSQNPLFETPMITAIQIAYYLNAQNTSDTEILVSLAGDVGCDTALFANELHSEETRNALLHEIDFSRRLGAQGFPSLLHESDSGVVNRVRVDYNRPAAMLEQVEQLNLR